MDGLRRVPKEREEDAPEKDHRRVAQAAVVARYSHGRRSALSSFGQVASG